VVNWLNIPLKTISLLSREEKDKATFFKCSFFLAGKQKCILALFYLFAKKEKSLQTVSIFFSRYLLQNFFTHTIK
jgi:hypothetical protein